VITTILFVAYIALAIFVAWLGRDRKFGYWGYLFGSLLLTPVIGLLLYLATDGPVRRPEPSEVNDR
jgi:hypothetical protein